VGAEAVLCLKAVVRMLKAGQSSEALAYAQEALETLERDRETVTPPPLLPPERPKTSTSRTRAWRMKRRVNVLSVVSSGTPSGTPGNALGTPGTRSGNARERVPVSSRAPVDLCLRSLSSHEDTEKHTEREGERERERPVPGNALGTPGTRSGNATDGNASKFALEPESGVKLKRQRERPPPSETPESTLRSWCLSRKLPFEHPEMLRFLDEQRNCKEPKIDWPAAWRISLARYERERRVMRREPIDGHLALAKPRPMSSDEIAKHADESNARMRAKGLLP